MLGSQELKSLSPIVSHGYLISISFQTSTEKLAVHADIVDDEDRPARGNCVKGDEVAEDSEAETATATFSQDRQHKFM